uniref:Cordon-bleu WH2 repeat protein n=1 Tax=Oryzias latipes TaxID=8090 RepID=A0A3P9HBU3_ORYLA
MTESKPPTGRVMKTRAPPPPLAPQPAPRHIFRNFVLDGGGPSAIDAKDNTANPYVTFQLTLPQGRQISMTEDGSKALMDLLVELCSRHHLNPALHTLDLWSSEGLPLAYKPNSHLGSLNVACVLIKEKVVEEKVARRPAPKVPEKTTRLMVNYHVNQKAVVRVNPLVALQSLIPTICSKCELDPSHVLLLKDSVSHHDLPLDKSLAELGIKELYVHDQSLDSISSTAAGSGGPQKKGLLGILQFSRRKSKDQSSLSAVSTTEDHPGILGKSQSVSHIHTMSPKTETKKRRAPPPPATPPPPMVHASSERSQVGLFSESQQKRKKAPPPPTFILQQDSDSSPPPVPQTSNGHSTEAPTPGHRINATQSNAGSDVPVELQTVEAAPLKQPEEPPLMSDATPNPSSPSPSSSSNGSLTMQESSSELCQSLDDSDLDLDASRCSSATSSSSVQLHPTTQSSSSKTVASSSSGSVVNSDSSSKSDTESALNLKLDEVENNRQSAVENADPPIPPKPPRSSSTEPTQHVPHLTISVPRTCSPVIVSTDSETVATVEAGSHPSWIYSMDTSSVRIQRPETEAPEAETLSLDSSNGSSSLPDQGYAASEGMAEVEDSSTLSFSPDQQSTSMDASLSLEGGGGDKGEKLQRLIQQKQRSNSSDSDEGCATWGSTHRHGVSTTYGKSVQSFEDDPELTYQLHQTLADFEASLADHMNINSAKDSHYTMSTNSNKVPVSVVDIDVPVTAIDDVLQDYEHDIGKHELTSFDGAKRSNREGSGIHHKSEMETQNKNNNACTTAVSTKRRDSKPSDKHSCEKREGNIKIVVRERINDDTISKKEDKQKLPVKSRTDVQKNSKKTEVNPDSLQNNSQKKLDLQPKLHRSVSPGKDEEKHRVSQSNSALGSSQGKITPNVTSRFGLKTFTVVPPKPSVTHAATTESAATLTIGAIKIDDQGNMVTAGVYRSKVSRSPEPENREVSPLLGQAKAFWSSNERQKTSVSQRKALTDKVKENTDGASTTRVGSEGSIPADKKTTQSTGMKAADTAQPQVLIEAKELVKDVGAPNTERTEAESNNSLFKDTQKLTNNPSPPPLLLPDLKRDLSFLKPSRRTSSQYVASAISKYAPKTAAKPSSSSSFPLKTETTVGFSGSAQSIQVNAFQSDNKDNVNTSRSSSPGPKSSKSCSEDSSEIWKNLERERFQKYSGSSKESSDTLNIETAKRNLTQSSGSTQTTANVNKNGNYVKDIRSRSPSPGNSNYLLPPSKIPTAPNTAAKEQISSLKENAQLPPSVTVSDRGEATGPPAITVFGPVKRFKPVIHKSVEKEPSLHGSLMEAIQTGGGKDRLKKISSEASNLKRAAYNEEGNEKSALLAAIRDNSNSSRLKKTKSEAASELEQIRRSTAAEEKRPASPPGSSSSVPSPPPPPPPPAPAGPPPPPPALLQRKPSSVANASAPMDPASTREAMLEAIRSGSAAGKLKKVSVPTKTVKVNARLGTIEATFPTNAR